MSYLNCCIKIQCYIWHSQSIEMDCPIQCSGDEGGPVQGQSGHRVLSGDALGMIRPFSYLVMCQDRDFHPILLAPQYDLASKNKFEMNTYLYISVDLFVCPSAYNNILADHHGCNSPAMAR